MSLWGMMMAAQYETRPCGNCGRRYLSELGDFCPDCGFNTRSIPNFEEPETRWAAWAGEPRSAEADSLEINSKEVSSSSHQIKRDANAEIQALLTRQIEIAESQLISSNSLIRNTQENTKAANRTTFAIRSIALLLSWMLVGSIVGAIIGAIAVATSYGGINAFFGPFLTFNGIGGLIGVISFWINLGASKPD